jgi:hypothetical protein
LKATTEGAGVQRKKMVGTLEILATPFLIEEWSIFVATLDGTTELIDLNQKFESPIFSTPRIIIIDRDELIIAEVPGVVHRIDFVGIFLRTIKTDGHIFSSFLLHQEEEDCMKILFGVMTRNFAASNTHSKPPRLTSKGKQKLNLESTEHQSWSPLTLKSTSCPAAPVVS